MKILFATLAMFGFMLSAANAQSVDCANATTQAAMTVCAERSFKAADAELNITYKALTQKVTEPGLANLRSAQRAWIAYRDAQCAFESAGTEDGSVQAMVISVCREDLTREQNSRLAGQLTCEEGDLSCGGQ